MPSTEMDVPALPQASAQSDASLPTRAIGDLMQRYCQAVDACEAIPIISLWPGTKAFLQLYFWAICLDLSFLTGLVDVPLLLFRAVFGRPHFLLGRFLYGVVARPFRSVWGGEIFAFKIVRIRYLTRTLLFYRAESRINDLRNAFNRQYLGLLTAKARREQAGAVAEAEEFQKTFEVFQKIITNTYQLKVLAVGGPLVALLAIFVNNAVIPLSTYLIGKAWQYVGGSPDVILNPQFFSGAFNYVTIFLVCLIWVLVSAWMDMRAILLQFDIPEFERNADLSFQLPGRAAHPLDLIAYLVIFGVALVYAIVVYAHAGSASAEDIDFRDTLQPYVATTCVLVCLGLIALGRRVWLGRNKIAPGSQQAL